MEGWIELAGAKYRREDERKQYLHMVDLIFAIFLYHDVTLSF